MADKFEWTKKEAPKPIKLKDLVCKDCFHRIEGRVDICTAYHRIKPYKVLDGGACAQYRKDDANG